MHSFQLNVELMDAPVKIFRKLLIPHDINMLQCHFLIQKAMGWKMQHLFKFINNRDTQPEFNISCPSDMDIKEVKEADKIMLSELKSMLNTSFIYVYDFSNDWKHQISFEPLSANDKQLLEYAQQIMCIEAQGACPPENILGVWAYADFLSVINKTRTKKSKEYRNWLQMDPKTKYDANEVKMDEINLELGQLPNFKYWNTNVEEIYT